MKKKSINTIYDYWLDWKFSAKLISTLLNVTLCSIAALLVANYIIDARDNAQQIGPQWITVGDQILLRASEKVSGEVQLMETLAKTPSLVAAVKKANIDRANWTPEMIRS